MAFTTLADYNTPPYDIADQAEQGASMTTFISNNEDELLLQILGAELYDTFKAGLLEAGPPAKWVALRDGGNYVSIEDGKTYKYTGVKKFIVPYVFAMWNHDDAVKKTAIGTSIAVAENSEQVSPSTLICNAFNKSSRLIGSECEHKKTLFGFLSANEVDYPNWEFEELGLMNQFNI